MNAQLPECNPKSLSEKMMQEIIADVVAGQVPRDVVSFSQLHDYVDANCYGGTESLMGDGEPVWAQHDLSLDEVCDICNLAMDLVDRWIKAGGLKNATA